MIHSNGHDKESIPAWERYEEYVLRQLDTLDKRTLSHDDVLNQMRVDVGELKTKIATWGAILAGAITIGQPLITRAIEAFIK